MKITNAVKNNPHFSGINTNKFVLSGLEHIANHGASFAVGASFFGAAILRPLVISAVPNTDKENKKYFSANSLSSGIMKLLMAEAVALPVENAIKSIDKSPNNFLNKNTLENFFKDKKSYNFLTQTIKQTTNLLTSIPKSYLTVALLPLLIDKFFKGNEKKENINPMVFEGADKFSSYNKISFKGNENRLLSKGISKLINNEVLQNFAKNHAAKDTNITKTMSVATDMLLLSASSLYTKKSKKIKEERKKPLIFNNILSTLSGITLGCLFDNAAKNGFKDSMDSFIKANKTNPKLPKYIDGINVLRPTVIFMLVYYGIIPVFTTYFADKINKNPKNSFENKMSES
jgi:hypothetical protein